MCPDIGATWKAVHLAAEPTDSELEVEGQVVASTYTHATSE